MDINPKTSQAYKLFHDGTLAFARAEHAGIRLNVEYTTNKRAHIARKMGRLERKFKETKFYKHWEHVKPAGPNIHSPQQLAHFLYHIKKFTPPDTTKSGQGSTSEESLKRLNVPELHDLLYIKKLKKIRDYLDAFLREEVNGYLHPSFNLNLVRTYRSSSDHPNFQNIPTRDEEAKTITRKALYPRPGHQLFSLDFSGLEVRIGTCYHQDSTMLKYINNPASNMHRDMAEQIFLVDFNGKQPGHQTLYDAAKNGFVFPQFYGDWYKACAESLACNWGKLPQDRWKAGQGIPLNDEHLSDHLIQNNIGSFRRFTSHLKGIEEDFWGNRFREYAAWKERWYEIYLKHGYFDMLTGFRCSGMMRQNEIINYPVQGAAFHCLLWSFNQLDRIMQLEKWNTRLIGQIHDEVVMDVDPKELNHVASVAHRITTEDLRKEWKWIITPLEVKMDVCPVDGSWADKQEFKL